MKTSLFLQDMITSLLERQPLFRDGSDARPVFELCRELLSSSGEVSTNRIGAAILDKYSRFDDQQKLEFFTFLAEEMDLDAQNLSELAAQYQKGASAELLKALLAAAEPTRQELLRRLNHVSGATALLVAMRRDLIAIAGSHPALDRADIDFRHLFNSWFNRGFLVLRAINWESPASILEKIIQYEAVHAINDWDDLRRRLEPSDRRCFAFFHPSLHDEPLVFVEVALCKGVPGSVQTVLSDARHVLAAEEADTAVFYSISNCQAGLRGISFGHSLIKQVVEDLSHELPGLKTFITLSPLPGFASWLDATEQEEFAPIVKAMRQAMDKQPDGSGADELKAFDADLQALAARYLLKGKRADGVPLDPVARFHLGNGAQIANIHARADSSRKGLDQSFGLMVNYLYDLSRVEKNHDNYAGSGVIAASRRVQSLTNAKLSKVSMREPKAAEA